MVCDSEWETIFLWCVIRNERLFLWCVILNERLSFLWCVILNERLSFFMVCDSEWETIFFYGVWFWMRDYLFLWCVILNERLSFYGVWFWMRNYLFRGVWFWMRDYLFHSVWFWMRDYIFMVCDSEWETIFFSIAHFLISTKVVYWQRCLDVELLVPRGNCCCLGARSVYTIQSHICRAPDTTFTFTYGRMTRNFYVTAVTRGGRGEADTEVRVSTERWPWRRL